MIRRRNALARALLFGIASVLVFSAGVEHAAATPEVCGIVTVTVDGNDHDVPYVPYCEPPCSGIPIDVGPVTVFGWGAEASLCIRNL